MSNASEVQDLGPVIGIESGRIEGLSLDGVDAFKNIPFGADTGGANRFRPPRGTAYEQPWNSGPGRPRTRTGWII